MVHADQEREVEFETKSEKSINVGFSAAVLSLLPFGVGGKRKAQVTHRYEIKEVETQTLYPSRAFIRQSVHQPQVLKYLASQGYRKSVYMVVGIKVAYGAHVSHETKREFGGELGGTMPGAVVGIPLDIGAKIGAKKANWKIEKKQVSSSFVFAYRLREVRYFKKDGSITDLQFTKGAQLHNLYAEAPEVCFKEARYYGEQNEIDVEGIVGEDYEEEKFDTVLIDGCIMVTEQTV